MSGSVEKRVKGGKVYYYARYRDAEGKSRSKSCARKADATKYLAQVIVDLNQGTYIAPADGRITFRTYAGQWAAIQHHRKTTADGVDRALRLHIFPVIGDRTLASLRPSDMQSLAKRLSDDLAPATVAVAFSWVRAILNAAVRDRVIARSPVEGVTLPRITKRHVTPVPADEVHALAEAIPNRYRALVILVAATGLRPGEAFGLTRDRVDFLRREVHVDRQLVSADGREPKFGPPKTTASVRTVPLPQVAVDALAEHVARFDIGADELLFTNGWGTPIRRSDFSKLWIPAVKTAGLPKGTRFHDLRHTYASLLIRHGESVKVVQARLGHASAKETLDTYAHMWPDSEDTTRAAVDDVLGRQSGGGLRAV